MLLYYTDYFNDKLIKHFNYSSQYSNLCVLFVIHSVTSRHFKLVYEKMHTIFK